MSIMGKEFCKTKNNMNKKAIVLCIAVYLILYAFNYLTPMSFGDDYLYAFVWQGHSMFIPLTGDATRVSSLQDLLFSQCSLYLTWGGRIVGQTLTQIFVWIGKDKFNVINAFVGVLIMAEIYWCMNKGAVSLHFKPVIIWWIFFSLWAFTPGYSEVFFWLTGACIYLWPMLFLLCFLLPYIQKYYFFQEKKGKPWSFSLVMFLLGIIAGCGNENSVCWIILVILLFVFTNKKRDGHELWLYTGLAGLIFGYAILMLAPGNMARLYGVHGSGWFNQEIFKHHLNILLLVLLFQSFMWYFDLKSIYCLRKTSTQNTVLRQDFVFAGILLAASFGMSITMLFSPEFHIRSGFPGTVPLVIATGILLRIQKDGYTGFITQNAKTAVICMSSVYFLVTASVTVYNMYEKYVHIQKNMIAAEQLQRSPKNEILYVKPVREASFRENLASGLHLPSYNLTEDEGNWKNVAFARYYGIKGIKVIRDAQTFSKN